MGLLSSKDSSDDNEMTSDFYFPTSKKALIIFTRNPELGKVKTRLAKVIGDENALEIYKFLLQHTIGITKNIKVDKYVFYSENIHRDDMWNPDVFRKKLQQGADLGERMKNAFAEIFAMGYKSAVIIGSDILDLKTSDIDLALETLDSTEYVLGPAADGGYYLLGIKEVNKKIFENKIWGTNTVLQNTLEDLKNHEYILMEEKNDIDLYEDIKDLEVFKKYIPVRQE